MSVQSYENLAKGENTFSSDATNESIDLKADDVDDNDGVMTSISTNKNM